MTFREQLALIRNGMAEKTTGPKPKKRIKPISDKKAAEMKEEKKNLGEDETAMEKWHKARRREATGFCKCGCGNKSQKNDDMYFRHSNCHIFPKAIFDSIKLHSKNCIELAFFGGCHSNMDNRSMDKWPMMECWDEIKEKFHILAPLLTDEERATKFYKHLEKLIYAS